MSFYTFATDKFTTFADLRRRPAVDKGQVVRTLALFIAFAIALGVAHREQVAFLPLAAATNSVLQ